MKHSRRLLMLKNKAVSVLLATFACTLFYRVPTSAQGASVNPPGGADGAQATIPALNVQRGNSLEGLFTPPNQWSTPQTVINPQPTAPEPGELNPLKNLFTPQVQWSTPQTLQNPQAQPPDGEVSHLKNVFTPPNQWSTPQTELNPQPVPRSFVPERQVLWGSDEERNALLLEHHANTFGSVMIPPAAPAAGSAHPVVIPQGVNPQAGKGLVAGKANTKSPNEAKGSSKESNSPITSRTKENGLVPPPPPVPRAAAATKEETPLKMSLSLMRSGDNERSVQLLDQIIKEHPEDASARYLKAVALVRMKQYKLAADEYREVIQLKPGTQLSSYARAGLTKIGL